MNQLKRLAQSASTQLLHSLEHTWEQKEAGKYPHSANKMNSINSQVLTEGYYSSSTMQGTLEEQTASESHVLMGILKVK